MKNENYILLFLNTSLNINFASSFGRPTLELMIEISGTIHVFYGVLSYYKILRNRRVIQNI